VKKPIFMCASGMSVSVETRGCRLTAYPDDGRETFAAIGARRPEDGSARSP